MNITILGAGKFGNALAHVLKKHKPAVIDLENGSYSEESKESIRKAELLVVCVPSEALDGCCDMIKPLIRKEVKILSCIKALYGSMKTPTELIKEKLGKSALALAGLNFADEMQDDVPTATTIGGPDAENISALFKTNKFYPYSVKYAAPLEFGAAAKNVLALAVGLVQGHYGQKSLNMQGAIIAKGIHEMSEICKEHKGKKIPKIPFFADVFGSCKAGSRNLDHGKKFAECRECTTGTVEGLQTLERVHKCTKTPLIKTLYAIFFKKAKIQELERYLR